MVISLTLMSLFSWTDIMATRHKPFLLETWWVLVWILCDDKKWSISQKDEAGRELVQIKNQALEQAISVCGPGKHFKDIGKTIHNLLRDINYSVSSQFTGHGIGRVFYSKPWILHHRTLSFPSREMQFENIDIYSEWWAWYDGARSLFDDWGARGVFKKKSAEEYLTLRASLFFIACNYRRA